jgi:hypothetical protein
VEFERLRDEGAALQGEAVEAIAFRSSPAGVNPASGLDA